MQTDQEFIEKQTKNLNPDNGSAEAETNLSKSWMKRRSTKAFLDDKNLIDASTTSSTSLTVKILISATLAVKFWASARVNGLVRSWHRSEMKDLKSGSRVPIPCEGNIRLIDSLVMISGYYRKTGTKKKFYNKRPYSKIDLINKRTCPTTLNLLGLRDL